MDKTGVIVVNTGSPETPTEESVRAYLSEFLMDPRLVDMPRPIWRYILNSHILPKRSGKSAVKYQMIWTDAGSPLAVAHRATAEGLAALLGSDIPVLDAMCYARPTVQDALLRLRSAGCERIVYVPLYPQSAFTQVGSCVDAFGRACREIGWNPPIELIHDFWDDELYLDAIVASIRDAGFDLSRDYLDLSYHAIPLRDVKNGDTYVDCVLKTNRIIAERLGAADGRWTTAFQSVFGHKPQDWTAPLSLDLLRDWGESGVGNVYLCCPGFAADCLETLYDIPHELEPAYRTAYREAHPDAAEPSFTYVSCIDPVAEYPRILHHVLLERSEFLRDELGRHSG